MPPNQPTSPSPPPSQPIYHFATGGFDFPQASSSPPAGTRRRPSGSYARPPTSAVPGSRIDQLAQFLDRRQQERERIAALEREAGPIPGMRRNTPATVNRPRAATSSRARNLGRLRRWATESDESAAETGPSNNAVDDNTAVIDRLHELARQPKRRKLHHDKRASSEYKYHKYGYEGQTVSTRLKMEVASCDGGEYVDDMSNTERLYKVQNVLRNDKSVYCSQSSSCNLLLKHASDAPFCLEKVVIRAPNRGFTAPVQEGLLFVSMTPDNMLSGTAAYQLDYSGRSPAVSPTPSAPEDHMLSLREAIDDPQIWMQSRQAAIEERIERLRLRRGRLQSEVAERDRLREEGRTGTIPEEEAADYCPYHVDEGEATAMGVSAPTPPPFTITAESGQEESDEDDAMPNAAVMADRLRRESRWIPERDSDDDDGHRTRVYTPGRQRYVVINTGIHRAAPRRAPSRIEPKESETESDGLIAPNAQFFIARHKNKITIKFTPAISGRYVLLKLWSPTHDGNIDIESVQVHGYSGPRFFPSVQPC